MIELVALTAAVFFVHKSWSVYKRAAVAIRSSLPRKASTGLSDEELAKLKQLLQQLNK